MNLNGPVELMPVLVREEAALARVVYRLTVILLLLAAGEQRFLSRAADDLDATSEELGAIETVRALTVAGLAAEAGIPDAGITLAGLLDIVDAREATALEGQGRHLAALLGEIEVLAGSATSVSGGRLREIRTALSRWTENSPPNSYTYGTGDDPVPAIRFDRLA